MPITGKRTTYYSLHECHQPIIIITAVTKQIFINLSQISTRTEFHCQQGKLIFTDIQRWRYISSRHKVRVIESLHDLYLLLPTLSVMGVQFQTTPFQSNLFLCNLQHITDNGKNKSKLKLTFSMWYLWHSPWYEFGHVFMGVMEVEFHRTFSLQKLIALAYTGSFLCINNYYYTLWELIGSST